MNLKRLHYLSLVARRLGRCPLLAAARKKLPAGGTEVTGYRDYAPGDDWRQIHWTLCAQRDELMVKLYEGDADPHVYLMIDCSPSMGRGRPAKLGLARQVAAALGYTALANLDRLGVAAFADGLTADMPLLRHVSRVHRLLEFLGELKPSGAETNLAAAAEGLVRRFRRPGPVVVISDLLDRRGFQRGFDLLRHAGYEPRLVHLVDPADAKPGRLGDVELADVETQSAFEATITERTARRYRALVADFHQQVRGYCRRRGVVSVELPCDRSEDHAIMEVLGLRRGDRQETLATAEAL